MTPIHIKGNISKNKWSKLVCWERLTNFHKNFLFPIVFQNFEKMTKFWWGGGVVKSPQKLKNVKSQFFKKLILYEQMGEEKGGLWSGIIQKKFNQTIWKNLPILLDEPLHFMPIRNFMNISSSPPPPFFPLLHCWNYSELSRGFFKVFPKIINSTN